MSQKWIRSQRWDDEHFPAWAWPAKFVLRALSSIWLAVVLLVLVCIYGTLASVPIGLLAKVPTILLYALTVLAAVMVGAAIPTVLVTRVMRAAGVGRAGRFAAGFLLLGALAAASVYGWHELIWPRLRYDAETGSGVMLFSSFVERYSTTTLRRLPGLEMSELEFYSWWPLRVILLTFVLNMVVATLRRIEFTFPNIGVLTVHSGIVVIALGSIYYAAGKQEGDLLLRAGPPDETGRITPGPTETGFYDNTDVVLWLGQGSVARGLEQRPIRRLPRYNDYGLNVLGVAEMAEEAAAYDRGRTLEIPVERPRPPGQAGLARMVRRVLGQSEPDGAQARPPGAVVDDDLEFTVVGYASYAELERRWVASEGAPEGESPNPMRRVELLSSLPGPDARPGEPVAESVIAASRFLPEMPAERLRLIEDAIAIEYTREMPESRWRDLTERLPGNALHGLVVEVPGANGGAGYRGVFAASRGARIEVGETGYIIEVEALLPRPPFPIITAGYRGAESSVAVVRVTPPEGVGGGAFTRYVYHRFPEINQDMLLERLTPQGMPTRKDADPAIRIGYIDASMVQVYLDELPPEPGSAEGGERDVRAIVRLPGRDAVVTERLGRGERLAIAPMVGLRLGERWAHATSVEAPRVVPAHERENQAIGTHQKAAVAVRVSRKGDPTGWSETVWVPFSLYLGVDPGLTRTVQVPDGREVTIAFGRRRHNLPGLALQLVDFEMIPYPHSDVPKDYRSELLVLTSWDGEFRQQTLPTSLNAPLKVRAPFQRRHDVGALGNVVGMALSTLMPTQYKFSQSGWDAEGWRRTKALVDAGRLERPSVRFTILGVGNNPGIYVIAAGAVMMCVGIPWAFYLKPWLVRRKKRKIQAELAARAAAAKRDLEAARRGESDGERAGVPAGAER